MTFLVIFISLSVYLTSINKNTFANNTCTYGIYIYVHQEYEKLKYILSHIQTLFNEPVIRDKLNDTYIYIVDNHSTDNNITKLIEEFNVELNPKLHIGIQKERIYNHTLSSEACINRGYTFLYPKCKHIMYIDIDESDVTNEIYLLTKFFHTNYIYDIK